MKEAVESLDDTYDTMLTNDSMFSQGQKQLLGIARAIVSNPSILLLDEITANLDSVTEQKVITVLRKIAQDRMVLSISHRLTSILGSDTLIILENGRIKNSGNIESYLSLESMTWDPK